MTEVRVVSTKKDGAKKADNNIATDPNTTANASTTPTPTPAPVHPTNHNTTPTNHTPKNNTSNPSSLPSIAEHPVSPVTPTPSQPTSPIDISYLSTLSGSQAVLNIFISNPPACNGCTYSAAIDKLSPNLYKLESHSLSGNTFTIFISIKGNFVDGAISIFQHAPARLLQSGSAQLLGSFAVKRFDSLGSS